MSDPLERLKKASERLNPAIEMSRKLTAKPLDSKQLLLMAGEIETAIKAGSEEIRRVARSLGALKMSDAVPSKTVPEGF